MHGAARHLVVGLAIALFAGFFGWQLGAWWTKADHLSLAQSIANMWESHFPLAVDSQGKPKEPADALVSAQLSLATLTMALATHYEQIPAEQWSRIEPRLSSTIAATPPPVRDSTAALIDCMLAARKANSLDQECVRRAMAVPTFQKEVSGPRK